ncbi:MAG TPA: cytochrome c [Oligoflexus sp.]|uniref:c-type cytochrome n=1 Tax=Oligoflexus sp. TaxID=1971216 RepID=UPI002D3C108F|nr:cytochrome c [Oligoflexus sp.]HYX34439.1 cytochrome c [Oligoflexus sp.]
MASNSHIFLQVVLLIIIGACARKKQSSPAPSAPLPAAASSDDAVASEDATVGLDTCEKEDEIEEEEKEEEEAEVEDADDDSADEAALKDKDKAPKVKKDCVPATTGTTPAASTTGASLAEGQKIYTANCQACHGALPGAKQGASGDTILASSTLGPHKAVTPWPAGQASTLSAAAAAESLSMAMK